MKDRLKRRGYRWSGEGGRPAKCWWREVAEADRDAEIEYLRDSVYGWDADIPAERVDAYGRFSDRL